MKFAIIALIGAVGAVSLNKAPKGVGIGEFRVAEYQPGPNDDAPKDPNARAAIASMYD